MTGQQAPFPGQRADGAEQCRQQRRLVDVRAVVAELRGEGRTLGKRWFGIRTVHESGRGIDVQASVVRNLARVVDEIPIAWIVPIFTKGHRRIGDMLAGTYVVLDPTAESESESWLDALAPDYASLDERRFPLPPAALNELVEDDLNLIEYVGERVHGTGGPRRRDVLARVAQRYIERLGLGASQDSILDDPERFLCEVGLQLRSRFERLDRGAR